MKNFIGFLIAVIIAYMVLKLAVTILANTLGVGT